MSQLPVVAIVGRPNVGKSTLFNRIIRRRVAIVDDEPGVTRDRLYARTDWSGREFLVVDTGGLLPAEKAKLTVAVGLQVLLAIEEADLVLFMVDLQVGPTLEDTDVARTLLRSKKQTILILNKEDVLRPGEDGFRFLSLGLGEGLSVSALHGHGVGDLLDQIVHHLPPGQATATPTEGIQVAVLGRPNVGKSSLVNAIVGEERVIVDSAPGTTRDAVDTSFHLGDQLFVLIDTAGLKKKSQIRGAVEFYSSLRTLSSLERCHVAVLVLDATVGPTAQDLRIVRQIEEAYKGLIMVLNKWDLLEDPKLKVSAYEDQVKKRYPALSFVPVLGVSALHGKNVPQVLDQILAVHKERGKRISTSQLNQFMSATVDRRQPPSVDSKPARIYYVTQQTIHPPTFVFFTNNPRSFTDSYVRFLKNQLRGAFGFQGTPLRIRVRHRGRGHHAAGPGVGD